MKHGMILRTIPFVLFVMYTIGCKQESPEETTSASRTFQVRQMKYPLWVRSASIYEVNIRQYTEEGTFNAFREQLPRLKKMGVGVLAMMPIYPISITKRNGTLGNYHAVADYTKVNPEFGTFEDFQKLVAEIHQQNMHVLLDWVPNHTGWDHTWIMTHPEWYTKVSDTITHSLNNDGTPTDWYDVADLNYAEGPMRNTMIESMKFWLRAADVDGFRCEAASSVPDDFWNQVRPSLEQIKPVFMLADSEGNPNHFETCFQANYGWTFYQLLNEIAQGKKKNTSIDAYLAKDRSENPAGYYHLNFTSNHDENSLNGSAPERFGPALEVMNILSFTFEGIPLIYSGQESRNDKRLSLLEKDFIEWKDYPLADFYTKLIQLKHFNKSLWNGNEGGKVERINDSDAIYAFKREKDGHRLVVLVNCTGDEASTTLSEDVFGMSELFGQEEVNVGKGTSISLKPWEYRVMANPSVVTQ